MAEKRDQSESKERGFAGMDPEERRRIARMGGRAAHQRGTAHQFSSDEARAAGRKGGQAAHERGTAHQFSSDEARAAGRKGGRTVSQDREHMAAIGRRGGEAARGGQGGEDRERDGERERGGRERAEGQ